jgi:hypothetical protein
MLNPPAIFHEQIDILEYEPSPLRKGKRQTERISFGSEKALLKRTYLSYEEKLPGRPGWISLSRLTA